MQMIRTRVIALALVVFTAVPAFAQSRRGDHWVGTWATAVVARPQPGTAPPGPPPGPPAATPPVNAGGPPPAAGRQGGPQFPPPLVLNNQTLREIVHTS